MRSEKPVELHRGLVPKNMFQATNTTLPPQRQRADPLVRISCLAGFCLHMRRSPSTTAQIPTIGERLRWFTVFLFLMPLMMQSLPELFFVPGATTTVLTPTGLSGRRYLWTTDHAEPSASPPIEYFGWHRYGSGLQIIPSPPSLWAGDAESGCALDHLATSFIEPSRAESRRGRRRQGGPPACARALVA